VLFAFAGHEVGASAKNADDTVFGSVRAFQSDQAVGDDLNCSEGQVFGKANGVVVGVGAGKAQHGEGVLQGVVGEARIFAGFFRSVEDGAEALGWIAVDVGWSCFAAAQQASVGRRDCCTTCGAAAINTQNVIHEVCLCSFQSLCCVWQQVFNAWLRPVSFSGSGPGHELRFKLLICISPELFA